MVPTYRFVKGRPGRSYGLAIARRLGFPAGVLDRAEEIRGGEAVVSVLSADGGLAHDLEERFGATVQVQDLNLEDIFVEMSHV